MGKPKILKKGYTDRVTRLEFSDRHYRGAQFDTDMYYVGIANRILPIMKSALGGYPRLTPSLLRELSVTLALYLEDLVSGTGIWEAFLSLCRKKYGKEIPFYDTGDESFIREFPSLQAVRFLLWYILNNRNTDTMLNPRNPALEALAMRLLPILGEAYDDAPDTPGRPEIVSEERRGVPVFYQVRDICHWLCSGCYLTGAQDLFAISDEALDFFEELFKGAKPDQIAYATEAYIPFNVRTGPLGITPQEWLAEIVSLYPEKEEIPFLKSLTELKSLPYRTYRFDKIEGKTATISDTDGNSYQLSAFTLPGEKFAEGVTEGSSALCSLVYFDGVWNINGMALQTLPPDFYNESKETSDKIREEESRKYCDLMKKLDNKPLGAAADFDELRSVLELPQKDAADIPSDILNGKDILFFVNPDGNISLLANYAESVKFPGNKLYNKETAATDGLALVFDPDLTSKEMRDYILSNNLVPDAALRSAVSPEEGHRLFQDNLPFFADYALRDSYAHPFFR